MKIEKIIKSITLVVILHAICWAGPYWCPDLVMNDRVDFADFAVLANNWHQLGTSLQGDLNADGTVDIGDLEKLCGYWLEDYECKSADFNLDYIVNFLDFAKLADAWLSDSNDISWNDKYDLDYSNSVSTGDMELLSNRWLKTYPEPNDTFNALKNALAAGNVEAAVSLFADSVADEYAVVLGELQAELPGMANGMGQLQLIYIDDEVAQYEMLHDEGGGVISSFPVYFSKDAQGNWKVYCF